MQSLLYCTEYVLERMGIKIFDVKMLEMKRDMSDCWDVRDDFSSQQIRCMHKCLKSQLQGTIKKRKGMQPRSS